MKKKEKKKWDPAAPRESERDEHWCRQSVCLWVCVEGEGGSLNHFFSQIWERKKRGGRGLQKTASKFAVICMAE